MSVDQHGLFRQLDPPPGGAERLRQRLEEAAVRDRAPVWRLGFAVSIAIVLIIAVLAFLLEAERNVGEPAVQRRAVIYDAPQFDRLLGRPLERKEPTVTLDERTATVAEIQSANDEVRIYRID